MFFDEIFSLWWYSFGCSSCFLLTFMRPLLLRKGAGASKCATKVSPFLLFGNIAAHNLSVVDAQNTRLRYQGVSPLKSSGKWQASYQVRYLFSMLKYVSMHSVSIRNRIEAPFWIQLVTYCIVLFLYDDSTSSINFTFTYLAWIDFPFSQLDNTSWTKKKMDSGIGSICFWQCQGKYLGSFNTAPLSQRDCICRTMTRLTDADAGWCCYICCLVMALADCITDH